MLDLKIDTVQKAINQGRIIKPIIKFEEEEEEDKSTTKSERNAVDDGQQMGKACSNIAERILAIHHQNDLLVE